ncbi:MAG: sodium:solute symporter [Bacteroidota bacterium]
MTPAITISLVLLYFLVLLAISWYTARNAGNYGFFLGNKSSPWYIVAFGMIGTSLSGVTFVSVPGTVQTQAMSYMMVVIGYLFGYLAIAYYLLPLYYRLQLTSIYSYLQSRFGMITYKSGAMLFIIARTVGATARLYLVIYVLQAFLLNDAGIPFWATAVFILLLIVAYTFKGGVKTIVWTDTLQTSFMLGGLVLCVYFILHNLNIDFSSAYATMQRAGHTHWLITDYKSPAFFLKHLVGGAFIAIAMTGLDQEMMQKNISVKTLGGAQKNVVSLGLILIIVNFLFLFLGGLLYIYAGKVGIDSTAATFKSDNLFPDMALNYFPPVMGFVFIIALISALFPSADGAITALTSSFCIDILGIQRNENWQESKQLQIRRIVHIAFALLFLFAVLYFYWLDNRSIIDLILKLGGYTYGPLLGLFVFGMFTTKTIKESIVPFICILSPLITWQLAEHAAQWFSGYKFGYEIILINGIITFSGLYLVSNKTSEKRR